MSEPLSKRMQVWPPRDLKGLGWIEGEEDRVAAWAKEAAMLEAENAELKRRLAGVLQCRQTHDDAYSVLAIANSEYAELATLVGVKHD